MKKILIVEDEAIIALSAKKSLAKFGYNEVFIVDSGDKAIEFVNASGCDLILMDIKINGPMDGIETMEEVRKFKDIPVIFTTGNSDPKAKERASRVTHSSFLSKPVEVNALIALMNKLLLVLLFHII